ncbi:unnamed protein product [Rotaria sp. Silwood1]|nr:unnamed protein product [Rotaria sp. Silwood1]CAF4983722.1 unnamed protein product [Rotaria sp. Silwood1]
MCDDLMRKLMKKLNMLIPEWELHRRINITIKQQIVSIIGLDLNQDYAYTLFSTVRILVKQNTQTIYDSKLIKVKYILIDIKMGSNSSQPPTELSEEDIEFISTNAKMDHKSVQLWYGKLKAACPNGKISKADTVTFLRSINSCKGDQIEKQANEIHKAFDANNDGVVGMC